MGESNSYFKVINLHFTIHPSNFCHLLLATNENELIKVQIEHREQARIAVKS